MAEEVRYNRLIRPRHAGVDGLDVAAEQIADVGIGKMFAQRPQGRRGHDGVADPARLDDENSLRR